MKNRKYWWWNWKSKEGGGEVRERSHCSVTFFMIEMKVEMPQPFLNLKLYQWFWRLLQLGHHDDKILVFIWSKFSYCVREIRAVDQDYLSYKPEMFQNPSFISSLLLTYKYLKVEKLNRMIMETENIATMEHFIKIHNSRK